MSHYDDLREASQPQAPPMPKYETRVTRLTVAPQGEPIFSEVATHVEIEDEAAGEYVRILQPGGTRDDVRTVTIDVECWPDVRMAIDRMIDECRKDDQ